MAECPHGKPRRRLNVRQSGPARHLRARGAGEKGPQGILPTRHPPRAFGTTGGDRWRFARPHVTAATGRAVTNPGSADLTERYLIPDRQRDTTSTPRDRHRQFEAI